ncbi:MAG: methyltransferase [Clostridia bacterium]
MLDLCAGSGCIGLAVASQVLRSRVLLGEWDEEALKVCRQNIRRNQLSRARDEPAHGRAREALAPARRVRLHRFQPALYPHGGH